MATSISIALVGYEVSTMKVLTLLLFVAFLGTGFTLPQNQHIPYQYPPGIPHDLFVSAPGDTEDLYKGLLGANWGGAHGDIYRGEHGDIHVGAHGDTHRAHHGETGDVYRGAHGDHYRGAHGHHGEVDFTSRYAELAMPVPPHVNVEDLVTNLRSASNHP